MTLSNKLEVDQRHSAAEKAPQVPMSQIPQRRQEKMEANNGEVASSTAPAIFDSCFLNPPSVKPKQHLREHLSDSPCMQTD